MFRICEHHAMHIYLACYIFIPADIFASYALTDKEVYLQYLLLFWGAIDVFSDVACAQHYFVLFYCDHCVSNVYMYEVLLCLPYLNCC